MQGHSGRCLRLGWGAPTREAEVPPRLWLGKEWAQGLLLGPLGPDLGSLCKASTAGRKRAWWAGPRGQPHAA